MTFYEKMDKAEKYFKIEKELGFMNPNHTIVIIVLSVIALIAGYGRMATLLSLTAIVLSTIGVSLTMISGYFMRKGYDLIFETLGDLAKAVPSDEFNAMAKRHTEVANKFN